MVLGFAIFDVRTIREDFSEPVIDLIPECSEVCKDFGLVLPELGRTDKNMVVPVQSGRE